MALKKQIGLRLSDQMIADIDAVSEVIVPNLKLDRTQVIEMALTEMLAKYLPGRKPTEPAKRKRAK